MVGNVGLWPAKTFVWTRVKQDLRCGGPLEMLSTAKPIRIKVQMYQFSLLIFNFRYIFLFTVFLQTAALQAFGKCRSIVSQRGTKGIKRENKKTKQDAVVAFFPARFLPCTSRSRGRYSRRLACLRSHVLRAYCNFKSKRAISITLFERHPRDKMYVAINW